MHQAPKHAAAVKDAMGVAAAKLAESGVAAAASEEALKELDVASLSLSHAIASLENAHQLCGRAATSLQVAWDVSVSADAAHVEECAVMVTLAVSAAAVADVSSAAAEAFVAAQNQAAAHLTSALKALENAAADRTEDNQRFAQLTNHTFQASNRDLIPLAIALDKAQAAARAQMVDASSAAVLCLEAEMVLATSWRAIVVAEEQFGSAETAEKGAAVVVEVSRDVVKVAEAMANHAQAKAAAAAAHAAEAYAGLASAEASGHALEGIPIIKDGSVRAAKWLRKAVEQLSKAREHGRMVDLLAVCEGLAEALHKWTWFDDALRTAVFQLHEAGRREQAVAGIRMLRDLGHQVSSDGAHVLRSPSQGYSCNHVQITGQRHILASILGSSPATDKPPPAMCVKLKCHSYSRHFPSLSNCSAFLPSSLDGVSGIKSIVVCVLLCLF